MAIDGKLMHTSYGTNQPLILISFGHQQEGFASITQHDLQYKISLACIQL